MGWLDSKGGAGNDYLPADLQRLEEPNAGWSTCPLCEKHWLVTPREDCLVPACGCYGDDASQGDRPCEPCGLNHAWSCDKIGRRS